MVLRAVIFDMDGVIVDTEPEYQKVELELMKKFHIPFGTSDLQRYTGVNPILMWKEIKEKNGHLKLSANELYAYEAKMMEIYYDSGNLNIIEPTIKLIEKVHKSGQKIGIASSSEKVNICRVLERVNIGHFFDAVVSNNDVSRCKPMPDIYLLAAEILCVNPRECVVIEDSISGVASAKSAGMKVVRYINEPDSIQIKDEADYVVSNMGDVTIPLLKGLVN